jgi:hypothetical protein
MSTTGWPGNVLLHWLPADRRCRAELLPGEPADPMPRCTAPGARRSFSATRMFSSAMTSFLSLPGFPRQPRRLYARHSDAVLVAGAADVGWIINSCVSFPRSFSSIVPA